MPPTTTAKQQYDALTDAIIDLLDDALAAEWNAQSDALHS